MELKLKLRADLELELELELKLDLENRRVSSLLVSLGAAFFGDVCLGLASALLRRYLLCYRKVIIHVLTSCSLTSHNMTGSRLLNPTPIHFRVTAASASALPSPSPSASVQ